ncbi:MAG: AsmA family protein [Alphaproteobacteria bacterium]
MKKLLVALLVLIILAGTSAYLLAPRIVNWEIYKPVIAALVSERTGLDVHISGPLSLELRPAPRFIMKFAKVENAGAGLRDIANKTADNIIAVSTVYVDFKIASLLIGKPRITVSLLDPQIAIERYSEGNYNIDPLIEMMFQVAQGTQPPPSEGEQNSGFSLESVNIIGGQISFVDFQTEITRGVMIEEGLVVLDVNNGTLSAEGKTTYQGSPIAYNMLLSNTENRKIYALTGSAERSSEALGALTVDLHGLINLDPVDVNVKASVRETYIPLSLDGLPDNKKIKGFWVELEAEASWGDRPSLTIPSIRLGHAALASNDALVHGKGAVFLRENAPPKIDLTLRGTVLDMAALQFEADRFSSTWGAELPTSADKTPGTKDPPSIVKNSFAFPEASIHILVEALSYGGETLRRLRAETNFDGETWRIEEASVQLPGVTSLTLKGALSGDGFIPKPSDGFNGEIELETSDLPTFLNWVNGASSDGLKARQANLKGTLQLESLLLGGKAGALRNIQLRALGSRLVGSLEWSESILRANIQASELDVAAWQELASSIPRAARATGSAGGSDSGGGTNENKSQKKVQTTSLTLTADTLRYGSWRGRGAQLRAQTGARGFWRVEGLRLDSLNGFRLLRGAGEIRTTNDATGGAGVLVQDMFLDVDVVDPKEAAIALGLGESRAALLAGAQAGIRVDGTPDSLRFSAKASLGGSGLVEANAILSDLTGGGDARAFKGEGFIQAEDAAEFLSSVSGRKSPYFVRGSLISDFALEVDANEGRLRLNGMRVGTFPLTAVMAWRYSPSLLLESRIQGGRLDLTRVENLEAAAGRETDLRRSLQHLPRTPIASPANPSDTRLKIAIELETVIFPERQLEDLSLTLEVADGIYSLSEGSASLNDSPLHLSGRLSPDNSSGSNSWNADFNLGVESIHLDKLLGGEVAERIEGVVSLDGRFKGSGDSVYGLWQTLSGSWDAHGALTYRPQDVEVAASLISLFLGDRLRELPVLGDWQEGLHFALSRFANKEAQLKAHGELKRGIFSLNQGLLSNTGASLRAQGVAADLSLWETDIQGEIYDSNVVDPIFHVSLAGPLNSPRPSLQPGKGLNTAQSSALPENSDTPQKDSPNPNPDAEPEPSAEEILKQSLENVLRDILGGG